jgi:FkbM family methyltransferase
MTAEKLRTRVLVKLARLARRAFQAGVFSVAVRGGDVHTYLALRQKWWRRAGIRTVVDIGANVGQFAEAARCAFPQAILHCFEPLPWCFVRLSRRFAGARGVLLYNTALADKPGTSTMIQSPFSPSSSLRSMGPTHVREFPWTAGGDQLAVRVSTLDDALADAPLVGPLLLKIDVQGTEDLVLAGGGATLARAAVVIIETSFEPLYEGQPLFGHIYRLMCAGGFEYRGSLGQLISPRDGRVLQADSVFVRR